ncbi:HlyD family type I secretion periplasmic adaptor subunit [Sphingomonas sp. CL5.1]|uniref:HlyD family type I secretion periplasmic adaptor subunit n=1 Tax=Sphingomonas sp. CL5.1 TaxID=2653203 RepID=UPI001582DE11|nr:HlyD family type I secretion periplasmic adaptor subunit [Sphingomonas sp. CL5.1]QKR99425.1 HlyD family type I secretion periplasmic adaptor subunit [Sphingomonas sp. CL5.1]
MNALTTNWSLVKAALAEDRQREAERLRIDDAAFLPAALEVIERPVSPTARLTARVMMAGIIFLAGWLVLGRTDIIASATGRIVPKGAVQLVQPAEAGVVRRILVHDGDHVKKGQPLVLLDPTVSGAEAAQAAKAYETAAFEVARTRAVIDALDGKPLVLTPPAGADAASIAAQESLARARLADIRATIAANAANGGVAGADIASARAEVAKLDKSLPLLDQQIAANEQLLEKGFVSRLKVLEMRRQRILEAGSRDAAREAIRRAAAQAGGAASTLAKSRADARAELYEQLVKATTEMRLRQEEMVKAKQRSGFQALRAPADGTVGQLSLHTEGGVVEAAKPIMTVVPSGDTLVAEVKLLNRDAGFVQPGQKVALKLDAFPFSRYGTVPGRVVSISPDAIDDEKLGTVYIVRVALDRATVDRGDRLMSLMPGMTVVADIVTGNRSYLSYLTSPIEEARGNALKER